MLDLIVIDCFGEYRPAKMVKEVIIARKSTLSPIKLLDFMDCFTVSAMDGKAVKKSPFVRHCET